MSRDWEDGDIELQDGPLDFVSVNQRDRWIRLFNRLEAAISHHQQADRFKDDHDEALYAARERILRDAAGDT